MNKSHFRALGLLAGVASAILAPSPLRAQSTINYSTGDLVLGFENFSNGNPTGSNDYLLDLGPVSYFLGLSLGTVVNLTTSDPAHDGQSEVGLGSFAADLSTDFGPTWYANSSTQGDNLQWGVVGTTSHTVGAYGLPINTFFQTIGETTPGDGSTAPTAYSANHQNAWTGDVSNMTQSSEGWDTYSTTANTDYGAVQSTGEPDSWTTEIGTNHDFSTSTDIQQPLNGGYFGPTNSVEDLYEVIPTDQGGSGTGTEIGIFSLDSSGDLTYESVPEPSTYAAIGIGAVFLLMLRRRRKRLAA